MSIRSLPALPCVLLLLAAGGAAQSPTLDARLANLCERLDLRRRELNVAGCAIAVVKDDAVVLAKGLGLRDVEKELPVTPDTVFACASTTKAFTATLVAMLVGDGKLAWGDKVTRHVPEFRMSDKDRTDKLTVRDLLAQTTGLERMPLLWAKVQLKPEEVLPYVAEAEPIAGFGKFHYSNVNYTIAGLCAARAGGSDWHALVRQRIFEPLGMGSTTTRLDGLTGAENRAIGYRWDAAKQRLVEEPPLDPASIAAGGAINSTVRDMARWLRLLLGAGSFDGNRLVSKRQLRQTWRTAVFGEMGIPYGLGWMKGLWQRHQVVHHGGNLNGFTAQIAMIPREKLGFVLLANATMSPLQQQSSEIVFSSLLAPELPGITPVPEPASGGDFAGLAGTYRFKTMNKMLEVMVADGRLLLEQPSGLALVLAPPESGTRWKVAMAPEIEVEFQLGADGKSESLRMYQSGLAFHMPRIERTEEMASPVVVEDLRRKATRGRFLKPERSYRLTGSVRFVHQGVRARYTEEGRGRDRYRMEIDAGKLGREAVVVRGGQCDYDALVAPPETLAGARAATWAAWIPARLHGDWKETYDEVEVVSEERVRGHGRKVVIVRLTAKGALPSRAYLDSETGELVEHAVFLPVPAIGAAKVVYRFKEYGAVAGAWMPLRRDMLAEGMGRVEITVDEVEDDVDLPAGAFELGR